MHKRVTIEDVAEAAGVSISTVSNFLNQRFDSMSETTRRRIETVIANFNYKPNNLARGLKGNKSRAIAIVVVNIGYPFCVSIIRSLNDILSAQDYSLQVCETGDDSVRERKILESLQAQQIDGIVIQTNGQNNDLLRTLAQQIPVVLIDREYNIPRVFNILTNNREASRELTTALFKNGYRHVLYVTEQIEEISTRRERLAGYQQACAACGFEPWVGWVNRQNPASFQTLITNLLRHPPIEPFALYTANGLIMLQLYPMLRAALANFPGNMGLATFDDPDWAKLVTPPMTGVSQPTAQIGQAAAESIIVHLKQNRLMRKRQVKIFDSTMVLRESTQMGQTDTDE
jgi:LacI family transcriptional regulator, kdg operon repressor